MSNNPRKPELGYQALRKGRFSVPDGVYFITTNVSDRKPLLREAGAAAVVVDSLRHLEKTGELTLYSYVVMPDHLHLLFGLQNTVGLPAVMRKFKGYTGKILSNKLSIASFWQKGYYDHLVRNKKDLQDCIKYMADNPVKCELVGQISDYPWFYLMDGIWLD